MHTIVDPIRVRHDHGTAGRVPMRDRFPFRRFGTGPSRRSPHIGGLLGLLAA